MYKVQFQEYVLNIKIFSLTAPLCMKKGNWWVSYQLEF